MIKASKWSIIFYIYDNYNINAEDMAMAVAIYGVEKGGDDEKFTLILLWIIIN